MQGFYYARHLGKGYRSHSRDDYDEGLPSGRTGTAQVHRSCPAVQMPKGVVVNYDLDHKGELKIGLRIPAQCTNKKTAYQNQWSLTLVEKSGLLLGDVVTAW